MYFIEGRGVHFHRDIAYSNPHIEFGYHQLTKMRWSIGDNFSRFQW